LIQSSVETCLPTTYTIDDTNVKLNYPSLNKKVSNCVPKPFKNCSLSSQSKVTSSLPINMLNKVRSQNYKMFPCSLFYTVQVFVIYFEETISLVVIFKKYIWKQFNSPFLISRLSVSLFSYLRERDKSFNRLMNSLGLFFSQTFLLVKPVCRIRVSWMSYFLCLLDPNP
jgi:hypothetical protein